MAAFFADIDDYQTFKGNNALPTKREPEIDVQTALDLQRIEKLERDLKQLDRFIGEASGDKIQSLENQRGELSKILEAAKKRRRRTMVTKAIEPRPIRILDRGDWMDESGEIVPPATPSALPPLDTESTRPTRLDLANWLFVENQALTSRVYVNRLWYLLFGQGLSRSLEDSGNQGEWPSHLDLLNEMAMDFANSGWHTKDLVRSIVLTRAYQRSSIPTAEQVASDPENRWLARQNRFRLPAEMIRDQALLSSGLLVDDLGGESSRPYQPSGYYSHLNFPTRSYYADEDQQQYRRGVYVHWQRQFLHPMLRAFDAPTREECTAQRPISNTPLAALTLLNDPSFVEAARSLAQRVSLEEHDNATQRIGSMFRHVLSRSMSDEESELLVELYDQQVSHYEKQPENADELLAIGMTPLAETLPKSELAALTFVARALLNTNEAVTRN